MPNSASAAPSASISDSQLIKFSQNNIFAYNPSNCIGETSSGVCGDTSEEKIWSILRQTFDPLHAAAAFGSISREGGFQPVKWEYGRVVSLDTCDFIVSWDNLYNGVYDGQYGVGSFGLTTGLSDYLHYINDNAPDLLQYFKDPSNTCYSTGDKLAEKIGEGEVDRLLELETNYFINQWIPEYKGQGIYDSFLASTDLEEAAIIWARDIEVCRDCGCEVCASSAQLPIRAAAAKGYYEKYKDFTCTAKSSKSLVNPSTFKSDKTSSCTTYTGNYPEYLQYDERWGNISYGPAGQTVGTDGCGAASMAMLATVATGQDIFPNDIVELLGNKWYWSTSIHNLDPIVGEHYGFEVKLDSSSSLEETKTKFRDYLKSGYMIHFTGAGCHPGFQGGGECSKGHVIGLFGIDEDDNVMQANSGWGGNQMSSLDEVAEAKTWAEFTAIKKNSGKNTCNGLCKTSGNFIAYDGLTKEQAQKVADYYNSSAVTARNFIDGEIPSDMAKVNCVSFSYWFVSAFTDASEKGASFDQLIGNGSFIADTGLPRLGWRTGNLPEPFSVFGGEGSRAWSHTGVVVGVLENGNYLTIEAAYGLWDARVQEKPPFYFLPGRGILAYPDEHFTPNTSHLGNKTLTEIIGN